MGLRERFAWLGRRLLPLANPARAIYGTVITGAVMTAYSEPPIELGEVALGIVVTVLLYWLAHVYAEQLAHGSEGRVAFSWHRLLSVMRAQWAMVRASFAPLIVLLAAYLFGATPTVALEVAVWFTVLLLVAWGVVAGRRDGLTGAPLFLAGLFAGLLGLVIVALKSAVD